MRNIFLFGLLLIQCLDICSQNNIQNAQRYWYYRKRLKEQFIQIDPNDGYGTNMPVSGITSDGGTVDWGDGNGGLPYYIALLATEYRLLKNNGIDYNSTRDELFHALMAFERLDWGAEWRFDDCNGNSGLASLNGFFIRNENIGINGKGFIYPCYITGYVAEESKDNIWHYLLGLALVKALVDDNTNYYSRFEGKNTTIPEMAKDITNRIISFMHDEGWTYGPCVSLGNTCHAQWMNGKCFYDKWVIRNPVTFYQVSNCNGSEDPGVIDEIPYIVPNYCGFQYGFAEAGEWITGQNLHYDESEDDGNCFDNTANISAGILDKDSYSFLALYTVMGGHTQYLINYGYNGSDYFYPHFILIDYLLHGNTIKIDHPEFIYTYQNLLNSAPDCGSYNFNGYYPNGAYDWSTSNSLVWPESKGKAPSDGQSYYYSGIDYMLLYNLFWLVYGECIYNNSSYSTTNLDVMSNIYNYDIVSLSSPATVPIITANKALFLNAGFTSKYVPTFYASVKTSGFSDTKLNYSKIDNITITCTSSLKSGAINEDIETPKGTAGYVEDIKPQVEEISKEILKIDEQNEVYIYPNPTNGKINIDLGKNLDIRIMVSNAIGHNIITKDYNYEKFITVDISSFLPGLYYLNLSYNQSTKTIKVIKQ